MNPESNDFYYDHDVLEKKYIAGEFKSVITHLLNFVRDHKIDIESLAQETTTATPKLDATRKIIEKRGSVHLPSEMAEQIQAINKEAWYKGEKGESTEHTVDEWTQEHSLKWREARKIELLFLITKEANAIRAILEE